MIENTVVERPFLHLLGDAIQFLLLAEQQPKGHDLDLLFSRSSIIHAVFSLESAANCCLREHPYPRRLLEKCDSFSLLEKFEFVLATVQAGKPLDRGCKAVQVVDELVAVRNRYVHPKAKSGPMIAEAIDDGFIATQGGEHPITGFSDRPITWKAAEARTAVKGAIEFLDLFFVDWCRMSQDRIERLLVSSATFNTELMGDGEGRGFGLMCDMRVRVRVGRRRALQHPPGSTSPVYSRADGGHG